MANSSKVVINESDQTLSVVEAIKGINGVQLITKRGPIGKASTDLLLTSFLAFEKNFGGLIEGDVATTQVKRAFDKGSALRINRVVHFTDITDSTTYDATFSSALPTVHILYNNPVLAGQTINVVIGGVTTSQAFSTSALNTMQLLAAKIKANALLANAVYDVNNVTSLMLDIVPKTVALTVTSTMTGSGTLPTATITTNTQFKIGGTTVPFQISPAWPGKEYDNIVQSIEPATNGKSNYFNLRLTFVGQSIMDKNYKNLLIVGNPTAVNSRYLDELMGSPLIKVTYNDLSSTSGVLRPDNRMLKLGGGSDGTVPNDSDYIGDSAGRTGFRAFDGQDDITLLGVFGPEDVSDAVHIAGSAYADARKDIVYVAHLSNTLTSENDLTAARDALGIDSSYTAFTSGGLSVVDPLSGQSVDIPELGDYFGITATSDNVNGPWYSVANDKRATITDVLGIVNNFGAIQVYGEDQLTPLDILSNHQIISAISKSNKKKFVGNFTAQIEDSLLSFLNIRKLLIYIKKSLAPTLEQFLEEPNDIPTWKTIYQTVQPFLSGLVTKRAIFEWDWQGDQFANSINNLIINNNADVDDGTYRVRLRLKPIPGIRDIIIDMIVTRSSVSFEEALS